MMRDTVRPSAFIIFIPVLLLVIVAILFKSYLPGVSCPVKAQIGIDCPGCGGIRASERLIAGDFLRAFQFNALITSGLTSLTLFSLWSTAQKIRIGKYSSLPINLKAGCLPITVIFVFTVCRNI